jgi:hypothetical protein
MHGRCSAEEKGRHRKEVGRESESNLSLTIIFHSPEGEAFFFLRRRKSHILDQGFSFRP